MSSAHPVIPRPVRENHPAIPCPICGPASWQTAYRGPIRHGKFPQVVEGGEVIACSACGVQRLVGDPIDYESPAYRALVETDPSHQAFYAAHDVEQEQRLSVVGLAGVRSKVVADVGAGAGSFLDAVGGFAARTIAIEPAAHFHSVLRQQRHEVFSYAADALPMLAGQADVVTSFAVVEHVEDPRTFVEELAALAKPNAQVVIATPNARDWLIDLLPAYAAFYYRTVHRWYFDAVTLGRLMEACGLKVERVEYRHRFDLSNALGWLRQGRPTGTGKLPVLAALDSHYRSELERQGISDYLYLVGRKPAR